MIPGGAGELPVRVGLVDRAQLVVETLHALLEARSDVRVVATARSVGGARRLVTTRPVDVLVMGAVLPDGDPLTLWPWLRVAHATTRVVILGTEATAGRLLPFSARRGRRVVVLPHQSSYADLVEEIRRPAEPPVPLDSVGRADDLAGSPRPTPTQQHVLSLLLTGATSADVALELGVSHREAQRQVRSAVATQLGVRTDRVSGAPRLTR